MRRCIAFDGEPAYDSLRGHWLSEQPYAVIYRMAIDDRYKGKGLAHTLFAYAEELSKARDVHSIKVDTDGDNGAMQHILKKLGNTCCGVIQYDGSDKIAFKKLAYMSKHG